LTLGTNWWRKPPLTSINSGGYTKRLPFGSPLVRIRPHLVLGYSRKKSSSVRNIEKEVEKVDNAVAKEEAEQKIVADEQSNINSTQHNVPPTKLKVAIKTRVKELTNEIERIQKPLRPSSRVTITSEWLIPSSSEADEFADTPVEDDQSEINSTTDSDDTISSDDDNTFGSHNTSDDDEYATALQNMTLDDFDKEVDRRRKEREAEVNNAESNDTNNNDSTENSFNIDNDNNTASTSDIVDEHDTVNDNENNPPSTANRLAGETRRNVRASTRGVSRPHYTEPSLKSKLRREDVENASSACNAPQPIPQSISTRGGRVGHKARNTTICYKEPSSKTKLRREP